MHVVTTKYGYVYPLFSSINTLYLLTLCIDLLCIIKTTMPQHTQCRQVHSTNGIRRDAAHTYINEYNICIVLNTT